MPERGAINSAGELVCRRPLLKADGRYVPGQHLARIIDPRPHRDRADLAAVLTYVDDEGRACSVTCMRYRDERGWRSISMHRAGLQLIERSTAVGAPDLTGELLDVVERAAADAPPYPYERPSAEERQIRRAAHKLLDKVRKAAS